VRLLIDTHTLLWFALGDSRLTQTARSLIADPANTILVSPASYWEIAIKISTGRYALNEPYEDFMRRAIDGNQMDILPIEPRHTAGLLSMPYHHKDPFDRLLTAQAIVEGISIVSADPSFDAYSVHRIW
jgi:PIN domain nuclease of toxin-antitoxin system